MVLHQNKYLSFKSIFQELVEVPSYNWKIKSHMLWKRSQVSFACISFQGPNCIGNDYLHSPFSETCVGPPP